MEKVKTTITKNIGDEVEVTVDKINDGKRVFYDVVFTDLRYNRDVIALGLDTEQMNNFIEMLTRTVQNDGSN